MRDLYSNDVETAAYLARDDAYDDGPDSSEYQDLCIPTCRYCGFVTDEDVPECPRCGER